MFLQCKVIGFFFVTISFVLSPFDFFWSESHNLIIIVKKSKISENKSSQRFVHLHFKVTFKLKQYNIYY